MDNFWAFMGLAMICCTVVALRGLRMKYRYRDRTESPDVETMQEMNRGLDRMHERIEALETLLMDQRRSKPAKSDYE